MGNAESARAIFNPPQSAASLETGAYAPASASLSTIAQQAQKYTGATGAAIALKEGKFMICHASAGDTAPDVGVALRLDGSFAGLCVQSGQVMQCHDAETDSRVDAAAARKLGVRSMVITPIHHRDAVVGILAVYSPLDHAFKERHIVVLKTMAEVVTEILSATTAEELAAIAPAAPASAKKSWPPEPTPAVAPKEKAAASAKPAPMAVQEASAVPLVVMPPEAKAEPVPATSESPRSSLGPVPLAEALDRPLRQESPSIRTDRRTRAHAQPADQGVTIFRGVAQESIWRRLLPVAAVVVIGILVAGFWIFRGARAESRKPVADVPAVLGPLPEPAVETSAPVPPAPVARESHPLSETTASHEKSVETTIFAAPKEPPLPTAMRIAPDLPPANLGSRSTPPQASQEAVEEPPAVSLDQPSQSALVPDVPKAAPVLAQAPKSSQVSPSRLIRRVPPVYPEVARRSGVQGTVVLSAIVTKDGRLRDVRVIRGNPVFRASAIAAVQQWVYKPGYLNGEPTETTTEITLTFNIPK